MIMDGLDTLSQVALADPLNISFDTYNPPPLFSLPSGAAVTTSAEHDRTLSETADDNLNTPVTACSEANFTFLGADIGHEPLPITGKLSTAMLFSYNRQNNSFDNPRRYTT